MVTAEPDPTLVRVARRCYVRRSDAGDLAAICAAAITSAGSECIAVGPTAARLHGMWLPSNLDRGVHLATVTPGRAARQMTYGRRVPFRVHRRRLGSADLCLAAGVPATSLPRTWIDVSALVGLADLVAAGDSALRAGATIEELAAVIDRSAHTRGVRQARIALPLLDGRSRSRPESHLRVAASSPRLPRFEVNVSVHRGEGGWLAEPDLSLAAAKIALEYQGSEHAGVERMRKDITRFNDLRRDGWLCIEYGPAEVFGRPWTIAPDLEREIARRAPHLLRRATH